MTTTPRTDALVPTQEQKQTIYHYILVLEEHARQLERELADVADAIHKIHPTRRGSLVDMVEDLESHRETAMNAFRLSEKELAAERDLADRLAETLANVQGDYASTGAIVPSEVDDALTAWKEARSETP
jgi:uncharacterized membrane protein YccC